MSDQSGGGAPQGGGTATQSATDPKAGTNGAGANDSTMGPDGKPWDPDRAMRTIEQQREDLKAAKAQAAEVDELRKKVEEFENEKRSETEKLTKRAEEAEARATAAEQRIADRETTEAIMEAAADPKIGNAKAGRAGAVARLIDRAAIERNAEGQPTNLGKLLDKARAEAPELFEDKVPTGDAEGGGRPPGPGTETMSDRIRAGFGRR